jgi:mono/diheme cytochrome c family protein
MILKKLSILIGISLIASSTVSAEDSIKGKVVFETHCAICHGITGKGDGAGSAILIPLPPDFSTQAFKSKSTKENIISYISNGKPGTKMVPWKDKVYPEDIYAVMEFIKSLGESNEPTN